MSELGYNPAKIKTGDVFYSACAMFINDDHASLMLDEYHVRSIRARRGTKRRHGRPVNEFTRLSSDDSPYVNLVKKDETTWVKKSSKTGDYGWASSIPDWYREQFKLGEPLPRGLRTTKLQALKEAERSVKWHAQRGRHTPNEEKKLLGLIKARISKLRNKSKK